MAAGGRWAHGRSFAVGAVAATAAAVAPDTGRSKAERPSLELVEAKRSRRRLRIAGTMSVLVLFGSMLGLAAFHSVLVQGQLELDRIDQTITEEQVNQTELRLQAAQLSAPERIYLVASDQGMVAPQDREYLAAVTPGSVVPSPAAVAASGTE